jgi:hypothetical protein
MSSKYPFGGGGEIESEFDPLPIDGFTGFDSITDDVREPARKRTAPRRAASRPRKDVRKPAPERATESQGNPLTRATDHRLSTKIAGASSAKLKQLMRCVRPRDVSSSASRNRKILLKLLQRSATRARIQECLAGDDVDDFIDHATTDQLKQMLTSLKLVKSGTTSDIRERLRIQKRNDKFMRVLQAVRDGEVSAVGPGFDEAGKMLDIFLDEASDQQITGMMKRLGIKDKLDSDDNRDALRKWAERSPSKLDRLLQNTRKVGFGVRANTMDRKYHQRVAELEHRERVLAIARAKGISRNAPFGAIEARVREQVASDDLDDRKRFVRAVEKSRSTSRRYHTRDRNRRGIGSSGRVRYESSSDSDDDYDRSYDDRKPGGRRVERIISRDRDRTLRMNEARKIMESRQKTNEKAASQENAARSAAQKSAQKKLRDLVPYEHKTASVSFDMERASMFLLACDTLVEAVLK